MVFFYHEHEHLVLLSEIHVREREGLGTIHAVFLFRLGESIFVAFLSVFLTFTPAYVISILSCFLSCKCHGSDF